MYQRKAENGAGEPATQEEVWTEYERARDLVQDAVGDIEQEGGNLAAFAAFGVRWAVTLYAQTYGLDAAAVALEREAARLRGLVSGDTGGPRH